jgi:3-hydroxyisobutyrate dehydrogenase-like beta-hydroxyacid dehydrogenase
MVGGDQHAFAAVEPLLRELGSVVQHIGPNGQGLRLKLAINISLAAQMLAFSEGVLLAERGGINRKLAVEVMAKSSIGSPFLRGRAPLVLDLPDQAWFDVELAHKDIRLALVAAQTEQVPLPSAALADEWLTTAVTLGYGRRDLASLHAVLAQTHESQVQVERAEPGDSSHRGGNT